MNENQTSLGRILVLTPSDGQCDIDLDAFKALADEVDVAAADEAEQKLKNSSYDWVFHSPSDFHAFAAGAADHQLGTILNISGQAVCILDITGTVLWANAKLQEFPPEVQDRLAAYCRENYHSNSENALLPRQRFLSFVLTDHGRYCEATISPIGDDRTGAPRFVAFVSDVTRSRRLQQKMDAIDNAGRELVRFDTDALEKMDVRQRLELLEQKIIRYTRDLLNFDNFAIRLVDRHSKKLELVWSMGLPAESQGIDIFASPENNGISGYVAATGRSYVCPDVTRDARYLMGINNARSSLTAPLRLHDQVIGVLNIESDELAAFSEDDRQFAEIFGRYVAIALHILDVLVVERHATTGRLASNVSSEIAGPLGDILADASTLMEDYIGHDDLRHRLQTICDNVVKVRTSIKQVTQPTGGILGKTPKKPEVDPLLAGKSILIADDEENILLTVRDVLAKYGCDVDTARDGTEACAMINRRAYDLVLSDIRMPGCDGYQVFEVTKAINADCPVIFMTGFGYDPSHSIIRARKEGLASVLYKPFKVDQLLGDVRAALSKPSQTT